MGELEIGSLLKVRVSHLRCDLLHIYLPAHVPLFLFITPYLDLHIYLCFNLCICAIINTTSCLLATVIRGGQGGRAAVCDYTAERKDE